MAEIWRHQKKNRKHSSEDIKGETESSVVETSKEKHHSSGDIKGLVFVM
jgi:hypothetical protein